MRTTLELRQPVGQLWLTFENDSNLAVDIENVEFSVRYAGHEREAAWPHFARHFARRERFELELTHYFRNTIAEAFPKLPNGESVQIVIQALLAERGAEAGPVARTEFCVRLVDGRLERI
jgi:hypothetical protein